MAKKSTAKKSAAKKSAAKKSATGAKAAKAKKSKAAKPSTAGKSKTIAKKPAKVVPTYLPEGASYRLSLEDVIKALGVVDKYGHLGKLSNAARRATTSVIFDAATVRLVKDFFVKYEMHTDRIGRHVVNPRDEAAAPAFEKAEVTTLAAGEDPFKPCNFGRGH